MNHELKIWPQFFSTLPLRTGELRSTRDRTFTEGDTITFKEWDPETKTYTGREVTRRILFVMPGPLLDAIPRDFALISLAPAYAPMLYKGEPFFVLRGQDKLAPALVREWGHEALRHGCPVEKVSEARDIALAMEEYPDQKYPD